MRCCAIPYRIIRISTRLVLIIALLMSLVSCIKEEFNSDVFDPTLQINPGIAAPIGWAKYRLDEILFDSLNPGELIIGQDSFITFIYNQDLISVDASEIISIPDVMPDPVSINTPIQIVLDSSMGIIEYRDTIDIPIALDSTTGAEIDSIVLEFGLLNINVTSGVPGLMWQTRLSIVGIPYHQITPSNDIPSATDTLESETIPLNPSNVLRVSMILNLFPPTDGSTLIIDPGPLIEISISLTEIDYSVIYGYLGSFAINVGPRILPVNFYNGLEEGTYSFSDPNLKIEFINSFGLPISIDLLDLQAIHRDGSTTQITGDSIPGPSNERIIAFPQPGQEGMSISDSILLTRDNTDNLFDILETSPVGISMEVNGSTNPAGENHQNFIIDTSSLSISSELFLPMEGYAYLLLLSDTLDFVFGTFYDHPPEEIEKLIFRINIKHRFPVDVNLQLYFTDDSYMVLDSLFRDPADQSKIVEAAPDENGDGIADEFEPAPIEIPLSEEQIDNISESHHIIVKGRITTSGYDSQPPKNVRFYSFYYFNAHIGAIAELEINSDGL
jgi:hypothetical protein